MASSQQMMVRSQATSNAPSVVFGDHERAVIHEVGKIIQEHSHAHARMRMQISLYAKQLLAERNIAVDVVVGDAGFAVGTKHDRDIIMWDSRSICAAASGGNRSNAHVWVKYGDYYIDFAAFSFNAYLDQLAMLDAKHCTGSWDNAINIVKIADAQRDDALFENDEEVKGSMYYIERQKITNI